MFKLSFSNKDNALDITQKLLLKLGVKVTNTTIEDDLLAHPNYPSLLSICDVISKYGVENIAVKCDIDKLKGLPKPFVVTILDSGGVQESFAILMSIENGDVRIYESTIGVEKIITLDNFIKRWTSNILLVDSENAVGEREYEKELQRERIKKITQLIIFSSLPILFFAYGISILSQHGSLAMAVAVYFILSVIGSIVTGLLVWYEIDRHNPFLKKICSSDKKIGCGAVLNSNASKLGDVSLSSIGFVYFAGSTLFLFFAGANIDSTLSLIGWLSIMTIPGILFSLYYQWRIIKQWCKLCLMVQGILVAQVFTLLNSNWHYMDESLSNILLGVPTFSTIFAFTVPTLMLSLAIPTLRVNKKYKNTAISLKRFKYDSEIFYSLLSKQKAITGKPDGLGIVFGDPDAKTKIIKVCNPYCGPCASAHKPIKELVKVNPDIQVQIIFTASAESKDGAAIPVSHFLAIDEKYDEEKVKEALDDWYLADTKDYSRFAAKYPMNGELAKQEYKIRAMRAWCDEIKIGFTPTFFVDGHQLPEMYDVSDLKYFLSV